MGAIGTRACRRDEHLAALDALSDAARFAYELCDVLAEPVDAASVAAAALDDDADRIWDELAELRGPACYRVALHPLLPPRCRWALARSGDADAAAAFIDAAHTPTGILERLVEAGHHGALAHPNVSKQLLRAHADGPHGCHVARNPAAPADVLCALARRAEPGADGRRVARNLATNPAAPAAALDELIGKHWDDQWWTGSLLASHPNTPISSIRAALEHAPAGGFTHEARARVAQRT